MSSAGQALGGVVGAIGGFIFGGPTGALYGAQLGMGIGGLLDPPKGPNLQGPRLSDLAQQVSTYGAPIPRVYGTVALYGNIIWLQGDRLTEVATETESGGKGGPTSTQTSYAYFASFAVALCQGPIAGVRRIWVGAELIYDAGSDDLGTILVSNEAAELFTLYLGTDTQAADPLIQADKGVNDTPAYRGIAYLVFDAYPLAKHGNSLLGAQVKVEVVGAGSSGVAEIVDEQYWPSNSELSNYGFTAPLTLAPASGVLFTAFGIVGSSPGPLVIYPKYAYANNVPGETQPFVSGYLLRTGTYNTADTGWVLFDRYGQYVDIDGTRYHVQLPNPGIGQYETWSFVLDDVIWILAKANNSTSWYLTVTYRVESPGSMSGYTLFYENLGTDIHRIAYNRDNNHIILLSGTSLKKYNADTAELVETITPPATITDLNSLSVDNGVLYNLYPISTANWLKSYSLETGALLNTWVLPGYGGGGGIWGYVVGNLLIRASNVGSSSTDKRCVIIKLPFIDASSLIPLADIVEAECLRSNLLDASDINVTLLTDSVRGYRIANPGSLRAALTPLQGVFPFDVVQSGYKIKFIPRGSASVDSIPESDLGANTGSKVSLFTISREMDIQLPRSVHLRYLDSAREYDFGAQQAERLVTDAVNRLDLDIAVVLNANEAAQAVERLLYLYWLERNDIGPITLPPPYRGLEPADVITVAYGADSYEVRLTGINYRSDGIVECTGKLNSATVYTSTAVADTGEVVGQTLPYAGPTLSQLLDIPALRDSDDVPAFVAALGGYTTGWPGAVLYRSVDSGGTWAQVGANFSGAAIGYATDSLAATVFDVIDAASVLNIRLYSGTALASVTLTQLLAGANHFAYGVDGRWEIVAAMTVTDNGGGNYTLTDFLRGRYGTEWAAGEHAANDVIVALAESALALVGMDSSQIDAEYLYRAVTLGKDFASAGSEAFTYTGVNLTPLSPVYLNGSRHPSTNDWTLTWVRRARIYAAWRDHVDVPLDESSEAYEIDIYTTSGFTTVIRTLTVTSATAAYTSAQQVADFGSNQATLYVKVYQLSDRVGRGYPLQATITR